MQSEARSSSPESPTETKGTPNARSVIAMGSVAAGALLEVAAVVVYPPLAIALFGAFLIWLGLYGIEV